jgi:hypothetical protein
MLGGLGNIGGILKQVKEMQGKMADIQKELETRRFEAEAGAGAVKAIVDGRGTLVDIKIDPESVGDVELLEDLIKGAVSLASKKAQEGAKEHLASLTGGMNIPGLSDLLGG